MNNVSSNSSLCPICKKVNLCSASNNTAISECWCMQVNIPESLKNNSAVKNNPNQCICAACAKKQSLAIGDVSEK